MLKPYLLQTHFEFFRDQHWNRGVRALSHLDIGHGQNNLAVIADTDEGIRREVIGTGGFAPAEWKVEAKDQSPTQSRARYQEIAPREIMANGTGRNLIEGHG
jgi:hypothetical protein